MRRGIVDHDQTAVRQCIEEAGVNGLGRSVVDHDDLNVGGVDLLLVGDGRKRAREFSTHVVADHYQGDRRAKTSGEPHSLRSDFAIRRARRQLPTVISVMADRVESRVRRMDERGSLPPASRSQVRPWARGTRTRWSPRRPGSRWTARLDAVGVDGGVGVRLEGPTGGVEHEVSSLVPCRVVVV